MPISACLAPEISSVLRLVRSLAEHAKAQLFLTKDRLPVVAKERTVNTLLTKASVSVNLGTNLMTVRIPSTMDLPIVNSLFTRPVRIRRFVTRWASAKTRTIVQKNATVKKAK